MLWAALAGLFLQSQVGLAENPEPARVTRLVVRFESPDLTENHFLRLPKTIFRSGTTLARVEEKPNPQTGLQLLLIVNAPMSWELDLATGRGIERRDSEPPFVVHLPVFPGTQGLETFEFGHEYEFFQAASSADRQVVKTNGETRERLTINGDGYRLNGLFAETTHRPVRVELTKGDKTIAFDYLSVEDLPAGDLELFARPKNIRWRKKEESP